MSRTVLIVLGVVLAVAVVVFKSATYIVDETEQVVVTQFGDPVGEPITEPGFKFKLPFIQSVHSFDQRYLEWNGDTNEIPTKDKRFIEVDTYARWRITQPLIFYQRLRNERGAQSRLDDIIDGATRDAVANNDLLEIVRASNRDPTVDEDLKEEERSELETIETGRPAIMKQIESEVRSQTGDIGIEVIDVRLKRLNYNDQVREKVFDRMIAERQRIAALYRSEGKGEAADIRGKKELKLDEITSEAAREAATIRGEADARVTEIYSTAHQKDADFFEFVRTLESYPKAFDDRTTVVMSTDAEYFKFLKSYSP